MRIAKGGNSEEERRCSKTKRRFHRKCGTNDLQIRVTNGEKKGQLENKNELSKQYFKLFIRICFSNRRVAQREREEERRS